MKSLALSLVALCAFSALATVYDEILPAPQRVELREGTFDAKNLGAIDVRRGEIAEASADVRNQAYVLDISKDGVTIVAGGNMGERYAKVTLAQVLKLSGGRPVPCARITDWPALRWRGVMNDCGRNFLAVEGVKAIIDLAAACKMNLFHWHLTDYHGWRLESKCHPRVTAPETMTRQVGKFYTQEEFREVVRYAAERGVTVMPEFDVPGHTLALRKGLGVETMKDPKVDRAVSDLLDELCSLAPAERMPFVHLGTDEVRVDPEYVDAGQCSRWAETVAKNGRIVVGWAPGQKMSASGEVVDMVWYDNHVTNSTNRAFDSARFYFASTGPELLLNQAAFVKPCRWDVEPTRKLGAIACAWHDDNVGEDTLRLFADATLAPAILGFADNFWKGRAQDLPQWTARLPPADTDAFRLAADLERRIVAQRDRVFDGFPYAFPYVAQTAQRWRVTWPDGRLIDGELPGGLVDVRALVTNATGVVAAEMWIKSPKAQVVGAWIGFGKTGSAYARSQNAPMPGAGQWDRFGSTVALNGMLIDPPAWRRPGARPTAKRDADGKSYRGAVWSDDLCETPLDDEWHYIREPARVQLKEGWNHVKLMIRQGSGKPWRGMFRLLQGSSEHPREVPDLEYSAVPQNAGR